MRASKTNLKRHLLIIKSRFTLMAHASRTKVHICPFQLSFLSINLYKCFLLPLKPLRFSNEWSWKRVNHSLTTLLLMSKLSSTSMIVRSHIALMGRWTIRRTKGEREWLVTTCMPWKISSSHLWEIASSGSRENSLTTTSMILEVYEYHGVQGICCVLNLSISSSFSSVRIVMYSSIRIH